MLLIAFSTVESSLLTAAVVLLIGMILIYERRLINTHEERLNKSVIIAVYLLSLVLIVASLFAIMWFWDVDILALINTYWTSITTSIEASFSKAIATIAIIFFSLFLIKISKMALKKIGQKESPNQRRKRTISKIITSIIKYTIGIISILGVLAVWGVNVLPALAGLGILGLVIGFGAQKFINDLISGFFIVFEHHYDVGDVIDVQGFKGEVIDIGLKTTKIRNYKGEVKIVANGEISTLVNFSKSYSLALIDFGIAYSENIQKTLDLLNVELPKMVDELPELMEAPTVLGVMALADSSVNIRVMAKTDNEKHYGVERKIRQRIKEILDANDIEIPFPQVVVHQPKE